jgi:elongation factor Ts
MANLELIKELRELTKAGMKDCKDALDQSNWNLEKALELVKIKGQNIVSSRANTIANEGIVCLSKKDNSYAMLEVNSQTDFVSNNQEFIGFAKQTTDVLLDKFINQQSFSPNDVETARQELVSKFKENIVVRRWWVEETLDPNAKSFSYVHSNNKIGVIVSLLASTDVCNTPEFDALGNDLAMQIAAMSPLSVSPEKMKQSDLEKQSVIFEAQVAELNKPEPARSKILEGKLNKWYQEVCLENQESVVVPKKTIKQVVADVGAKLGTEIVIINFIRCSVGEGLQKTSEQLADEVNKLMTKAM